MFLLDYDGYKSTSHLPKPCETIDIIPKDLFGAIIQSMQYKRTPSPQ